MTVLGRGSRVIGGTHQGRADAATEVEKVLVDGFFPTAPPTPSRSGSGRSACRNWACPTPADPAVTQAPGLVPAPQRRGAGRAHAGKRGKKKAPQPTAVLFNGGVFKAEPLRERLVEVLNEWAKASGGTVKELPGADLDLAVARGAAYYGLVRRGKGVRIRGGTARAYYVGVETSLPAVPGSPPPIKALCVVPFGMEEGTEADVPGQEFGLVVGEPAEFRFLGSTVRRDDTVGTLVEEWEGQIEELSPLATTLEAPGKEGQTVPVHLHSKVTEVGTLELWCISRDGKQRWKLEFNVRERGSEPQAQGLESLGFGESLHRLRLRAGPLFLNAA